MRKTSKQGFTLIEITVAVAIILVLISIAGPRLLRSRVYATEAVAMANLKTIWKACQLYYNNLNAFPDTLASLNTTDPPYLEEELASGNKQNYKFTYDLTSDGITLQAEPTGFPRGRYFYLDEDGSIHANAEQPAGPEDEIVK